MKNKTVSNIILAVGGLLLFGGLFTLIIAMGADNIALAEYSVSGTVLFLGIVFLYLYVVFFRKTFHFVIGMICVLSGILLMLIKTGLVHFSMLQFWPFVLLFSSISIFIAGKIKFRKLVISFDFTALFLFIMFILFSLFSFDVFPFSFKQMMYFLIPILMILGGFFLVFLFIHRQKINDILKNDDSELIDDGESENF